MEMVRGSRTEGFSASENKKNIEFICHIVFLTDEHSAVQYETNSTMVI